MAIQKIYYGAPGTGKSYLINDYLKQQHISKKQIFRTTFHPEYSYSDFVGQLLPTVANGSITYTFHEGVFTQALKKAFEDTSRPVFLVLEELSRGNVASIFGDLFQLLDRNDKQTSMYPIRNSLVSEQILQLLDNEIYFPANFNILCSVNTSDQNVYIMDTAFKRRFEWEYVSTSPVRDNTGNVKTFDNVALTLYVSQGNNINTNWHDFYQKLNQFITDKNSGLGLSEDKQVGQFFIRFEKNMSSSEVKNQILNKLLQFLWEDIQLQSYSETISLFDSSISNYSTLHSKFKNNEQVFDHTFLQNF